MCRGREKIAVALSGLPLSSSETVVVLESKMESSTIKWPKKE